MRNLPIIFIVGLALIGPAFTTDCNGNVRAPEGTLIDMAVYVRDLHSGRCVEIPRIGDGRYDSGIRFVADTYCQSDVK